MNIYMIDESPRVVARCVPDDVWERRLFDAVELVSEGAAHWENEEAAFVCHDMNHAWVSWVRKSRFNWLWCGAYMWELICEAGARGYKVDDNISSYADFIKHEYGETPRVRTIPPRCVPREFKDCKATIPSAIEAYRGYVRSEVRLHMMGMNQPEWLEEAIKVST